MKFSTGLRCIAPVFFVVAFLHLCLGAGAEVLLGASLSEAALSDPVLDSQNRFYGVSFSLYGVLLFLVAAEPERYRPVLAALLAVFFLAGVARLVSIMLHGLPGPLVLVLLALELLLPPLLWRWSQIEWDAGESDVGRT